MDYLTRLAQHALGQSSELPLVQPRLPSRFEPTSDSEAALFALDETVVSERAPQPADPSAPAPRLTASVPPPAATHAEPVPFPAPHVSEMLHTREVVRETHSEHDVIIAQRVTADAHETESHNAPSAPAPQSSITPTPRREIPAATLTPTREAQRADNSLGDDTREASAPIIRVTIGRVDVRAVLPAAPARKPSAPPAAISSSLEEYLRKGGRP